MNKKFNLFVLLIATFSMLLQGCAFLRTRQPSQVSYDVCAEEAFISCTQDYVFRDEFRTILDNLITSYWDPSGNWQGDIQGDATFFASMLLYALGDETDDISLTGLADQSAAYEASLVKRFFYYPVVHMDLVMGFPALAQRYLHTGEKSYRFVFLSGVRSGNIMISLMPGTFVSFVHDYVTLYATTSCLCFLAYEVSESSLQKTMFRNKGLAWIEKANSRYWDKEAGLYEYSQIMDWPQSTMMMALAAAYRVTGDDRYLDRCLEVLSAMDELCWDSARGGYYGHPDLRTKGLSGNNNMVWVLLDLYELTGEKRYLERAGDSLEWILSEDLYNPAERIIYHHWDNTGGRADYFCTGCNFQTLYNIYRFNLLK
jgi:hypothetical protein